MLLIIDLITLITHVGQNRCPIPVLANFNLWKQLGEFILMSVQEVGVNLLCRF